jgi:endoglucanase
MDLTPSVADRLSGMTRTPLRGVAVAAFLLALLAFAPGASASGGQNSGAGAPNPLLGQTWWDQNTKWNPTWNGYRSLMRRGRREDALKVLRLAETPQFKWFGMWEQPVIGKLRGMFEQAGDSVPLLAVFGDEHQGCGSPGTNTSGGLGQNTRYRSWIDQVARGIGSDEVVIAFEPDSLGLIECLRPSLRAPRLRALAYGVTALSKLPNATVYVEAGAPDWQDVRTMARKLRAVGVSRVRGFMLNATHHVTTAKNLRYGAKLSRAVGGKHFIVNTSHNGNGPLYRNGHTIWCNPPNAAAGPLPTTDTRHPKADAFLWVERPGYSNGSCNGGPARVGAWWEQRAIQMVERAKWWRRSR